MAAVAIGGGIVAAPAWADESVYTCDGYPNEVFQHHAVFGISTTESCTSTSGTLQINAPGNTVQQGQAGWWVAAAPPGLFINNATAKSVEEVGASGNYDYGGGFFWRPLGGGSQDGARYINASSGPIDYGYGTAEHTAGFPSSTFGFQIVCGANPCKAGNSAGASVQEVWLDVGETSGPALSANGLWGHVGWVRANWPISLNGDSPSGVCSLSASVDGQPVVPQATFRQDPSAWHQCSSTPLSGTVKTAQFPNGNDTLTISGTDAAQATASPSSTIHVDNSTPSVSLSTPNDPDLNLWVNHAVTVKAAASSGPSGLAAFNCAVDRGKAARYRFPGLTVNGDGIHKVVCNAAGGAIDPNGNHTVGTASENIRIDEAPPAIQFAPVNPADPTALAVQTGDPESRVAGASITMQGPHAKVATPLPATMSGSELLSRFNDGGKNGNYTFTATACDRVGNCASTRETLHFPIRLRSNGLVSFAKIQTPAKTVRRRVRVGYHYKTVHKRVRVGYHLKTVHRRRHGKLVTKEIKVGGHFKRVKVVIHANRRCGHRRVKTARHRWREISVCRVMKLRVFSRRRVRYGHKAKLHGLLMTAQGAPIANAPVDIMTRPDDRGGIYRLAATATTDARGRWVAKIPGGPSRAIRAYYPGAADVEPVTAHAKVIVPAKITLRIKPYVLPWSHKMHISGHLAGRYHPHDGVALRLLVRYPHTHAWTPLQALRTNRLGGFHFSWSYHAGRGVATYPFKIATTSNETDYPYAAHASSAFKVTFGKRTPRSQLPHYAKKRHRHKHRSRHRRKHQ